MLKYIWTKNFAQEIYISSDNKTLKSQSLMLAYVNDIAGCSHQQSSADLAANIQSHNGKHELL